MKDRITIEGRDGTFGAYIARPKPCRLPPSLFCRSCLGLTPTSARPATNWQSKALSRSRPIYSGVRSRASTSASPPRPTGNTAFAFIKPMTETPAPEMLRTPSTLWPNCPSARARLPSWAIASAG